MSNIESVLNEMRVFIPSNEFVKQANISGMAGYQALCKAAEQDYPGFWAKLARETLQWKTPFTKVLDESNAPFFKWFEDGELNVSYNCLDTHLPMQAEKVAIIFEADDGKVTKINYRDLHARVCQFANGLKSRGIRKGDRVIIYMPMSIEAVVAMQACARIGAIHSVVFGGFSARSLHERITDAQACAVITADAQMRGGKVMPLKPVVDEALTMGGCEMVHSVIVYQRAKIDTAWNAQHDIWWHDLVLGQSTACEPEWVGAEHPLFILYTSGSTGRPKGVQHSSGGYLLGAMLSMQWVFDYKAGDIFWCTADVGWVTGHTYVTYGPLAMGATQIVFEGIPTYPDAGRFWKMIQNHKVTTFYTAPTAIRSLIKLGGELPRQYDLSSLRLLGTVGEPINPEAWMWYHKNIGHERCPIVDTWWQTETGMILITPLPGIVATKPGSATRPFPGIEAEVVDEKGNKVGPGGGGYLLLTRPWPSMLRTVYGDPERYVQNYWSQYPGKYFTGDGCKVDTDGYLWLLGRVDDVMNVAGHRISTYEVESALVDHPAVAEAAVIGRSHELKGQGISAFVTLKESATASDALKEEIRQHVVTKIGAIARPDDIFFCSELPKTRSAKIMRRLLRDVAEGRVLGDTTTLADPNVLAKLKTQYQDEG